MYRRQHKYGNIYDNKPKGDVACAREAVKDENIMQEKDE